METNANNIVEQIAQRSLEINFWILARNLVWLGLLILAVMVCMHALRKNQVEMWIVLSFVCLSWGWYEGSTGYYIHMNGSHSYRMEEQLPNPEMGHEHQKAKGDGRPAIAAAFGTAAPFLALFVTALVKLRSTGFETKSGPTWSKALLFVGLLTVTFYSMTLSAAKLHK